MISKNNIRNFVLFLLCMFLLISCGDGATETEFADIENRVYISVNQHRTQQGLIELEWNNVIAEQCRIHSENMAEGTVDFGHEGFDGRIESIREDIEVSSAGENVAYNIGQTDPAETAVNAWLGSSGHRANIEGDYTLTGVGVARSEGEGYYFTQIFVRE